MNDAPVAQGLAGRLGRGSRRVSGKEKGGQFFGPEDAADLPEGKERYESDGQHDYPGE